MAHQQAGFVLIISSFKTLNVNKDILRVSSKNLPYKVRAAIADVKNTEYFLTVDVNVEPLASTPQVNLQLTTLATLKYNIMALVRQDKNFLLQYCEEPVEYILHKAVIRAMYKYSPKLAIEVANPRKEVMMDHYTYGENAFKKAYDQLRETLIKEELLDLKLDNGQYARDVLDSLWYSPNFRE